MTANANTSPESTAKLVEALINHGVLTQQQAKAAVVLHQSKGGAFTQVLVELGFLTEDQLTSFMVKAFRIPHLNLLDYQLDNAVIGLVPEAICKHYRLLPIDKLGSNLTVAMVNPLDDAGLAAVREACPECRLKPIMCSHTDFMTVIQQCFESEQPSASAKGEFDAIMAQSPPPSASPKAVPEAPTIMQAAEEADPTATVVVDFSPAMNEVMAASNKAYLVCLDGWEIGREIELEKAEHIVGRAPDADTVLNSKLVSRQHVKIVRMEAGGGCRFVLSDLKSSNGTFVNNVQVSSTALQNGDKVLIGDVLFKFLIQDEVEARFHRDVHRMIHYHTRTGLLNIDAFMRQVEAIQTQKDAVFTLAMVGVDGLNALNEQYGHRAGSIALSDMGEIIRNTVRDTDIAGFYGGDTAVVLYRDAAIDSAFALAEDLRCTIEAHTVTDQEQSFRFTVSIGLAEWPQHGQAPEQIISAAQNALKQAKTQGKNQTVVTPA